MTENTMYAATTTTLIEIPESFWDLLRELGINLNASPKTINDAWIKWVYTRNQVINQANTWYSKIRHELKEAQETLEWQNDILNHSWGISLDVGLDLSLLYSTNWGIPAKAIPTLKRVYEQLPTRDTICEIAKEADTKARAAWVKEVMETAHKRGATFLVFKTCYEPYDDNVAKFEASVRERKQSSIRRMCIGLEWLACSIDDAEDILLKDIGCASLNRCSCKAIDYIVD